MSREDGYAAIHLEKPARVPRTEYSVEGHWALLSEVTDVAVSTDSDEATKQAAQKAFFKAWNYGFRWSVRFHNDLFQAKRTSMGHAEYAAGGTDRNDHADCPWDDPEEILDLDFDATYGTLDPDWIVAEFNKNYAAREAFYDDLVNMTGVYVTLISGLIEICGWDMLLMAAGMDTERFGETANRYARWMQPVFDGLARCDAPVVMIHDDIVWTSGAIFRPDWYRTYVFPNYKRMFAPVREAGKRVMYTSDGTYTDFVDDIAPHVHGFVMEPTTDLAMMAERYGQSHVLVGNADTRELLSNDKERIRTEVERCFRAGKDCPGFIFAVGNHIPANTPVEACLYYNDLYETLSRR